MEAYREKRRTLFDDMMATIDKAGNAAALALVHELHRAERAGGLAAPGAHRRSGLMAGKAHGGDGAPGAWR